MRRLVHWFVLLLALAVSPAFADPLALTATPVPLDPRDEARNSIGQLIYRGGIALEGDDARFGGWSDLKLSPDGKTLTAISDRGFWLDAKLVFDAGGRLKSLADARIGDLIGPDGRHLGGANGDAEGLASSPDGSFYVSFERRHRILHYPAADPPFSEPPRELTPPLRLKEAPPNGGLEALLRLSSGRLIALTEALYEGHENLGWIGQAGDWSPLHYKAGQDFKPTSLAEFPPGTAAAGDIAVLERRFTFFHGPGARIMRVPRERVRADAHLQGEELLSLQLPLTLDNFEGLAITAAPGGSARLFIISDDNYSAWQRTLLLCFEYPAKPAAAR